MMSVARNRKAEQAKERIRQRTEEALKTFTDMIRTGNFPEQLGRIAVLSLSSDIPAAKWSAGNQLLMLKADTGDARGYRQWQEAGRQVKKGAKAIYIFSPRTINVAEKDEKTGEEVKKKIVVGFGTTPVFRIEDTEGEPVPTLAPPKPPPLMDVAEAFGVSVTYAPTNGVYAGYYRPGAERIVLCTHAERVFFHELAHAAHYRVCQMTPVESADKKRMEVVAETAAAALSTIYGYIGYETHSAEYIAGYANTKGDSEGTLREIMRYAAEVKAVLELILTTAEGIVEQGAAA